MFGGIDPKKMQAMMRQMGIKQEDIEAMRVIIERPDGRIVIEQPTVTKIIMQGQESWQIAGQAHEETGISSEDIEVVMDKTGKPESEVRAALEASQGDIAQAIIALTE